MGRNVTKSTEWKRSQGERGCRVERLEDRRLMAGDMAFESSIRTPYYESRAVPLVAPDRPAVAEPVGGSRPNDGVLNAPGRLSIEIIPGRGLRSNVAAMAAVDRAAAQWEAFLHDPITVSIEVDLGGTNPGVLGFAIPTQVILPYSEVRAALMSDGLDEIDDTIVARLPSPDAIDFALPEGTEFQGDITIAKANAKAIGLRSDELDDSFGVADGGIILGASVPYDFNRADGIEPGQFDFETVVAHEIGHVLGFLSSTDLFAVDPSPETIAPTTLDLFRFRSLSGPDNPRTPAAFENLRRELRPSTPAAIDYVLDDGWELPSREYPVELGEPANVVPTDPFGYQASHWQDADLFGETIGVLVPTIPPQQVIPISNVDWRAMDLIGYDVLPPSEQAFVPLLNDDVAATESETRIVIDVLANDRNDDIPFQLSTFRIIEPPLLGEIEYDPSTGLIVYEIPAGREDDVDAFTYTIANDQGIFGEPALAEIVISGLGKSPIAIDDFVLTRQGQSVEFNPLANDIDDAPLELESLQIVLAPTHGDVVITSEGLRYSPLDGFSGSDSFTYSITNSAGLLDEGLVEVTIGDTLIPPAIPGQPLSLLQRADVNRDRTISALDALMTINFLRRYTRSDGARSENDLQLDVSGDGNVTASDALLIINLLSRVEAEGEYLALSDGNDDETEDRWFRERF